jgi:hypothetical protein
VRRSPSFAKETFGSAKKLRKSAVKSLESFARVNLCARQSRSIPGAKLLLVQIR